MTLDTRHNLLSVVLIGAIAALIAIGLVSFWLLRAPDIDAIQPAGRTPAVVERGVARNPELAELSEYQAIVERPVFFAERSLPVMEVAGAGEESEAEPEPAAEIEIPALEASVAGIIITPEVRLAMVTDQSSDETLVLREGMALAGDKSAWKVAQIRPRGVRFETDDGRSEDIELEVETAALKTGAPYARAFEDGTAPGATKLGSRADAASTTVVAVLDENAIQVLDPVTNETETVSRPSYLDPADRSVDVFRADQELFVLPEA